MNPVPKIPPFRVLAWNVLVWAWNIRTTIFGYVLIVIGTIAASDGLFSDAALRWFILANGILTACLGHYNNRSIRRDSNPKA